MLLGLCVHCGCEIYSDGPQEFEGVFCRHEVQTELEEVKEVIKG